MKRIALLVLVALGACGPGVPTTSVEPLSASQEECRAEARRDPEVARILAQVNSSTPAANAGRIEEERRVAETRAWRRCLTARGLTLPGGVEIIQPR